MPRTRKPSHPDRSSMVPTPMPKLLPTKIRRRRVRFLSDMDEPPEELLNRFAPLPEPK